MTGLKFYIKTIQFPFLSPSGKEILGEMENMRKELWDPHSLGFVKIPEALR